MASLYEMTKQFEELNSKIESGEIPEDAIGDTLDAMELTIKDKSNNVSAFILNQKSKVKEIKEAMQAMQKRMKSEQKKIEWLEKYLLDNMIKSGIQELECPQWKVKVGKNPPSVELHEEAVELLDEKYITQKVTRTPNKKEIKKAIQQGEKISGAALVSKPNLRWS
tara:strand:+ start:706 stop:1203 length:498 start_codon:yes stop_codon:yes gene_type:complete